MELCNVCDRPGRLTEATDVNYVPCNVRRFKNDIFTMWRCTGCGSIHCKEHVDLTTYYAHYPLREHKLDFHASQGYRKRLALLRRLGLKPGHRVLDFGCGAGLFVGYLRQKGFANPEAYDAYIPAHHREELLKERYDAVVSYDVIEHDEDPRRLLCLLANLLKLGGLLVIGTPNADRLSLHRAADPQLHPPYHRHILSERALVHLVEDSGLQVRHVCRRSFFDTLIPSVNSRFMWRYIERSGGFLDAAVEPARLRIVWGSPELLFWAFFGYFFPRYDNIIVTAQKPACA